MIANLSKCETSRVGEAGRIGSSWRDGEEQVEGESGGETEGWQGLHREPLRGHSLGRHEVRLVIAKGKQVQQAEVECLESNRGCNWHEILG